MDTIFALSSGRPPAAIAVIRISGPDAFAAVTALAGSLPQPRRLTLRALRDAGGGLLDRALVAIFPGPDTATGEDIAELHCHGGRAIVAAVETALAAVAGLRRAEPGEFTRRALANGRIDLSEADGLADLLAAETEAQRVAAITASEGAVSRMVQQWMAELTMLSARVEAMLDFSDEDDVAATSDLATLRADIDVLADAMDRVLDAPPVERLRDGIRVALAGPANSGKSTLLNLLSERDAAIVSPRAGTTRDRIEVPVVRDGIAYLLIDTAGLNQTDDVIEAEGIARAQAAMANADIVLWLGDTSPPRDDAIWIYPRADLPDRRRLPAGPATSTAQSRPETISGLWDLVASRATALMPRVDRTNLNHRQRECCNAALTALRAETGNDLLVTAEHLRMAGRELAMVLGVNATEQMLDAVFHRFCIGK